MEIIDNSDIINFGGVDSDGLPFSLFKSINVTIFCFILNTIIIIR